MAARFFLGLSAVGFLLGAALHLSTFTPLAPARGDAAAAALLAASFAPLAGMLARLRRAPPPPRAWGRLQVHDWRALWGRVPRGIRRLALGAAGYVGMNLALSLMLVGGLTATEAEGRYFLARDAERWEVSRQEYREHRRLVLRLETGHLLLFYLVPLLYFRFADPARGAGDPPPA